MVENIVRKCFSNHINVIFVTTNEEMYLKNCNHIIVLVLALLVCPFSLVAQQSSVDSLEKLLNQKSDTAKVGVYIMLGKEYAKNNINAAESVLNLSLELCDSMNYVAGLANTLKALGDIYTVTGEYSNAYKNIDKALGYYRSLGDMAGVSECFLSLSTISNRLADYPKALEHASNALVFARQVNHLHGMAMAYNLMGIVYDNMGNFKSALANYQKSLEIYSSTNDKVGMGKIYLNIAIIYNKTGRKSDAENLLNKCVAIGKEFSDVRLLSITYGNMGLMNYEAGDFNKALEFYQLSLDMKEKLGDQHSIMIAHINIGSAYFQLGQTDKALQNILLSVELGRELGAKKEIMDSYKLLAEVYEKKGDFRNAYDARTLQMLMNDSVFGQDQMKYMADVEKKNAISQLESENKILRQQSLIDQLKIENSRFIRYYLLIGLAFAVVLIGLLIYQSSERRKNSRRLDEVNRQLVVINEQLKLSERNLAESNRSKDQFFSIISHDLRNPLASMVSFVRILKRDFETLDIEERQTLIDEFEKIVNRTGNLLENLLLWSRSQTGKISVSPSAFAANLILEENIDLHEVSLKTKNIRIEMHHAASVPSVFADLNMLNTVMRNLLSNAVKFTPMGGSIELGYNIIGSNCVFFVKDSGIGIAEDKLSNLFELGQAYIRTGTASEKGSGLGLVLCKDFVEKNNGKIWVESIPNSGTTFYFSAPIASVS